MSILTLIVVILLSLAASAFFSGTETGMLSVSREQIIHLVRKGGRRAKMIQSVLADMDQTTTALLIGNNLANVTYSSTSTAVILSLISDPVLRSMASLGAAILILYFGEFLPKLLFSARPLRRTLLVIPVFRTVAAILHPLTRLVVAVTDVLLPHGKPAHKTTADDISRIIRDRQDGVRLSDFEHALITKLLVLRASGTPVTKENFCAALDTLD